MADRPHLAVYAGTTDVVDRIDRGGWSKGLLRICPVARPPRKGRLAGECEGNRQDILRGH